MELDAVGSISTNGAPLQFAWQLTARPADGTSPVHVDEQGSPMSMEWLKLGEHIAGERNISPEQMQKAVDASRASFERAFGKEALDGAMGVCR